MGSIALSVSETTLRIEVHYTAPRQYPRHSTGGTMDVLTYFQDNLCVMYLVLGYVTSVRSAVGPENLSWFLRCGELYTPAD